MAISRIGPTGTGESNAASPVSANYSLPAGTSTILVVALSTYNATSHDDVKHDVTSLTKLVEGSYGSFRASLWWMINPPDGLERIYGYFSGSSVTSAIAFHTFQNVDQTRPWRDSATGGAAGSPVEISVPSQSGDMVVDVFARDDVTDQTPGAGQVQVYDFAAHSDLRHASSYESAVGSSTVMSWSGADAWAAAGGSLIDKDAVTGWSGGKINTVGNADIAKVNGLLVADIAKVNTI